MRTAVQFITTAVPSMRAECFWVGKQSGMPVHNRKNSLRLNGYDSSQPGVYFVTVVTQNRACLFGEIENGEMRSNPNGQIVIDTWLWLARQYPYVELGDYCLMPNHFHGILVITDGRDGSEVVRGVSRNAPTEMVKSLGRLIGAFKPVSIKKINILHGTPANIIWQRNFYDHVIRNDRELNQVSQYIHDYPFNWAEDQENPGRS